MLCGYPPFESESEEEILEKVKKGSFTFQKKNGKIYQKMILI